MNKKGKNKMSVTTANEYIKVPMPKVNILRIRKLLETNYKVEHNLAEGIAEAIDTALQDQETDGFATKGDINEVKIVLKSEIKDLKAEMHYMEYRLLFRLGLGLGTLMISIGTGLAWYVQFLMGKH